MKITVILTCFNRKEKTIRCIESLKQGIDEDNIEFIVVDDNSSDGTVEALNDLKIKLSLIQGNGSLYWAGGMRKGIGFYLSRHLYSEYVLLVNDDVSFYPDAIDRLICTSKENDDAVVVGPTCDKDGNYTYGAIRLYKNKMRILFPKVAIHDNGKCDTFNCNCVLLPNHVLLENGNFDSHYIHSLADLDYGLRLSQNGYKILQEYEYIGVCEKNEISGIWIDRKLSIKERLKRKESAKGSPVKIWFYFQNKNFGLLAALRGCVTSYIRVLTGK